MAIRRKGREVALELLFQLCINIESIDEAIETFLNNTEIDLKPIDMDFVRNEVEGTMINIDKIDENIKAHLKNWDIRRISKINLSILRLSTYEILFEESIPDLVAIDEAIELSKIYSDEKSTSFINGVLNSILKSKGE